MASEVISVLNSLIETAKDGETGFKHAAEHAKDASLKSLFVRYGAQRATYAAELQTLVTGLGEKPAESGHIAGALHRGWLSIKEAVAKDEDKALVDEAEAGEDVAIKAYKDALTKSVPAPILSVIEHQYSGVQESHAIIRDLKHNWTGTAATALV